ncbi:hypothetical protein MALU111345_01865 [Marinicrinis lubricantis]
MVVLTLDGIVTDRLHFVTLFCKLNSEQSLSPACGAKNEIGLPILGYILLHRWRKETACLSLFLYPATVPNLHPELLFEFYSPSVATGFPA